MRGSRPGRTPRGDDGAEAVEFALIWTFALVPLILGLIWAGMLFYSQITITQAAREAARQVALDVGTTTAGTCDSACQTNATATATNAASPLSITTTITTCPANATQGTQATVTLKAPSLLSNLWPFTVTVTGSASMPCGG
ncbi:MAG: pilus assembly protein [Jatrophihabitans sp.]|nr:MAG: pilus assembly protein [Jatrophihabitans sp.]